MAVDVWVVCLGLAALASWVVLALGRGGFWRVDLGPGSGPEPAAWPDVVAVIPARNEAAGVGEAVGSLLRQDYPGSFSIVLVDDQSGDGTAEVARRAAADAGKSAALTIVQGVPSGGGWSGKLWAMRQGVARAAASRPEFYLFTDADISYGPGVLRPLVAEAVAGRLVLSSLMVELRCVGVVERALIPAFVFFFRMLYPFRWVGREDKTIAAAAGGVMLASRKALEEAGGLERIRSALIDDCALAAIMKRRGPVRLAMTRGVYSGRPYETLADARSMISRSAYAQLRYSPVLLAGTVVGMLAVYVAPVLLALFAEGAARWTGVAAWLLMASLFQPTLRFYRLSPLWGLALPAIALAYLGFTLDSAVSHARGVGGLWKGRAHDMGGVAS